MFGRPIFYRHSRFADLQEAGEFGDFTGRVLGSVAKLTSDWVSELFAQPVGGKNLMIGRLFTQERRGRGTPIGILEEERVKHVHIIGPTGTGKTTTLANLIVQDILLGNGVGVIDIQGDLTPIILSHVPPERWQDVVILDATDVKNPVGFNILEAVTEQERSRTASEVVGIFKKTVGELSWGPRLEHFLRCSVLSLLFAGDATLVDLRRLLLEKEYRESVLRLVTDPIILDFWRQEFDPLSESQRLQAILPILNKIGPWLTYPESRNIIDQKKSSFIVRQIMDKGQILIVRIPQGILGGDVCSFLGALIVSKVQMAIMSRSDTPSSNRRPFYFYVDEFQNFITDSFVKILTEARAFGLGLIVANQFVEQLSSDLMIALDKNVVVRLTCQKFEGQHFVEFEDMHELGRPKYLVRPLPSVGIGNGEQIKMLYELSRRRYGRPPKEAQPPVASQTVLRKEEASVIQTPKRKKFNMAYEE